MMRAMRIAAVRVMIIMGVGLSGWFGEGHSSVAYGGEGYDFVEVVVVANSDELYLVMGNTESGDYKCVICSPDQLSSGDSECLAALSKDTMITYLSQDEWHELTAAVSTVMPVVGATMVAGMYPSLTSTAAFGHWGMMIIAVGVLLASVITVPGIYESPDDFYRLVGSVGVPEYDEVPLSRDERYAQLVKDLRAKRQLNQTADETAVQDSTEETSTSVDSTDTSS